MVIEAIIPVTKKLGKELIKEANPEHKLRVCAYVKVFTDSEEQDKQSSLRYHFAQNSN